MRRLIILQIYRYGDKRPSQEVINFANKFLTLLKRKNREEIKMQVKIDRRELLKMINVTLKAVSSKASFEELEGLKVSADTNGQITLQSTNPDMSISYSSSAEVIEGGEFVIKAKMFEEAVKRLYDGDVVLASDGDRSIRIESGKSRFKLTALSAENFPHSEDIENKFEFSIPQKHCVQ